MNFSAVLLAGGESRRMGRDKATMEFGGKYLWQIQLDLLRSLQLREIFISARTDPPWRPVDVRFIADNPPSRGPLSGLCASIMNMGTGHLIALAIDMPLMNEPFLRSLCRNIEPGCGVLPVINKRAEPLAAIYPSEAGPHLIAALAGTDFSLQTVTKELIRTGRLKTIDVRAGDETLFRNLNDLTDLNDSLTHQLLN
jgi:molybdenum cofactor guanylyltransferase